MLVVATAVTNNANNMYLRNAILDLSIKKSGGV
jgi:hypothetical protein